MRAWIHSPRPARSAHPVGTANRDKGWCKRRVDIPAGWMDGRLLGASGWRVIMYTSDRGIDPSAHADMASAYRASARQDTPRVLHSTSLPPRSSPQLYRDSATLVLSTITLRYRNECTAGGT